MKRTVLGMIIVSVALSACGTKGLLYLPEREYPLPAENTPAAETPNKPTNPNSR